MAVPAIIELSSPSNQSLAQNDQSKPLRAHCTLVSCARSLPSPSIGNRPHGGHEAGFHPTLVLALYIRRMYTNIDGGRAGFRWGRGEHTQPRPPQRYAGGGRA